MASGNVLVVDDSPEIRAFLERYLRREGYAVSVAEDGQTALRLLDHQAFEVAVVDLVMPGMDGVEVLREIRQRSPRTDVIILTGYGELETAATTLRLGASYYFQKEPFNLNLIPLVIQRLLEAQRLAQMNEQLLQDMRQANEELELARQQQLASFVHIGRALEGDLGVADMAVVLGRSLVSVIDCDAAGVLVTARDLADPPVAALVSRGPLSPTAVRALNEALADAAPPLQCEPQVIQATTTQGPAEPDGSGWAALATEALVARETVLGLALVARYADRPFSQNDLDLLRILSSQGGIALQNTYLFARMRDLATRDSLTELYNHRHFYELLGAELSRSARHGYRLGVIMIDLDKDPEHGLKAVNDALGHQAGDALLRQVANRLRTTVRRADVVARYGGDEFAILAPECGPEQVLALARRVWRRIREEPFVVEGREVWLTASLGAAVSIPGVCDTPDAVIRAADRACYLAKEAGRDQVCLWETEEAA